MSLSYLRVARLSYSYGYVIKVPTINEKYVIIKQSTSTYTSVGIADSTYAGNT